MKFAAAVMIYFCTLNVVAQFAHGNLPTSDSGILTLGFFEIVFPFIAAIFAYRKTPSMKD